MLRVRDVFWTLGMFRQRMFHRLAYAALDRAGYLVTLALLHLYDWIAGPVQEPPTNHAIREEGERLIRLFPWLDAATCRHGLQQERLRKAFPEVEFHDPTPRQKKVLR